MEKFEDTDRSAPTESLSFGFYRQYRARRGQQESYQQLRVGEFIALVQHYESMISNTEPTKRDLCINQMHYLYAAGVKFIMTDFAQNKISDAEVAQTIAAFESARSQLAANWADTGDPVVRYGDELQKAIATIGPPTMDVYNQVLVDNLTRSPMDRNLAAFNAYQAAAGHLMLIVNRILLNRKVPEHIQMYVHLAIPLVVATLKSQYEAHLVKH
ncbi:MAG: hypothetical protein NBV63_00845 [Candidatus Pacebacteria bacterium]|nr:hypothetical protein [Candidatus Paceibacterota bacterium]